ncbi:DUF459 domain-containing protein, partial [Aeromonas veronii]|uniref:DUF459 domain-containing protein n=1 Tax=Aeromonas veronii TaxID=654 RepID=UPI0038B4ABAB
ETPLAVVVLFGLNDRESIPDGEHPVEIRSERWRALYQAKVDDFLKVLADKHVPIYWTGLPTMRQPTIAADAA